MATYLGLFEDPRLGIESLRVFHNGFAELFSRDDLWQGMLFLYADLTRRINLEAELEEIVTVSGHFDALEALYLHTQLRDQIRGRENLFLEVNLDALRRYAWYLDKYDPKRLGTNGSPGFFGEPCSLVKVALLLTAEIDPAKYAVARDQLGKTLWDETQDVERLRDFLHAAIQLLE